MPKTFVNDMRIEPGSAPKLEDRDPGFRPKGMEKKDGLAQLEELTARLELLHARLAAEGTRAVLLVLQGVDTSGKDGTIRHVFTRREPAGLPGRLVQGADRPPSSPTTISAASTRSARLTARSGSSTARTTRT